MTLASPSGVGARSARPSTAAQRTWIVTLAPETAPGRNAARLSRDAGGSAGRTFKHALNGFVFRGSRKAAAALARNPNVRTVVADQPIHAVAETTPVGIRRIDARHPTAGGANSVLAGVFLGGGT